MCGKCSGHSVIPGLVERAGYRIAPGRLATAGVHRLRASALRMGRGTLGCGQPIGRIMEAERPPAPGLPGRRVEITIAPGDGGVRLDRALQRQLPELSRTRLKQLMLTGAVASGGKLLRDPAQRAGPGATVVIMVPEPDEPTPAAQPIALDIRFEDEHLIVLEKPAGMVVHPAPGNLDGTLVNALLAHCGPSLAGIGGVRRPGIVHRLDKDTSGLLVAAKTETAHRALSRDFALRRIARACSAIVWCVPAPAAGEIAGNIGRSTLNRKKMAVV